MTHKVNLGWGYAVCGEKYVVGDDDHFSLYWTNTNCPTCLIVGMMRIINEGELHITVEKEA